MCYACLIMFSKYLINNNIQIFLNIRTGISLFLSNTYKNHRCIFDRIDIEFRSINCIHMKQPILCHKQINKWKIYIIIGNNGYHFLYGEHERQFKTILHKISIITFTLTLTVGSLKTNRQAYRLSAKSDLDFYINFVYVCSQIDLIKKSIFFQLGKFILNYPLHFHFCSK